MSHWKPSGKKPDLRVLQYRIIAGMHVKTACLLGYLDFLPELYDQAGKTISDIIGNYERL